MSTFIDLFFEVDGVATATEALQPPAVYALLKILQKSDSKLS